MADKSEFNRFQTFEIVEYEITGEPVETKYTKKITGDLKIQYTEIYELVNTKPEKAIEPLLNLIDYYPDIPQFPHMLFNAYYYTNQLEKAEKIAKINYEKFPDYLFAKTDYAQICIWYGLFNRIPKIFKFNYDLKALYPKRNLFHFSEFLGFSSVMCVYYYGIGEVRIARLYYKAMKSYDKYHPMVKQARRIVYPGIVTRILRKLIGAKKVSAWRNEIAQKNAPTDL